MKSHIVIIGSGFAGTWAAIAAARAATLAEGHPGLDITVVSPAPEMHIRPRLYEAALDGMAPDVSGLFEQIGVRHIAGQVDSIDTAASTIEVVRGNVARETVGFERCVLAAGSHLFRPPVPGLNEHAFDVDQLDSALRLDAHLRGLAQRDASEPRNTVVIVGGGFTGIEGACEMPARLRAVLGADSAVRVVLIEQSPAIGPDLGPGPRPVIETALADCGVETLLGTSVVSVDAGGVTTSNGTRIDAATVVWTAGARAHPLTAQISGEHDRFGRIVADDNLRAPAAPSVFVTGDVACAVADDAGHLALMSCQHALILGRVAGYNAAADLLGLPLHAYRQPKYVTCLDLGPWGAVFTEGWERNVTVQGADAKTIKRDINTKLIYPPTTREDAFAVGAPDYQLLA